MNWYENEKELQRNVARSQAAGQRAYERRDLDEVVARQRREQRQRLGTALAVLFRRLRRRSRPAMQPDEAPPVVSLQGG